MNAAKPAVAQPPHPGPFANAERTDLGDRDHAMLSRREPSE
jgi:hypothetical protein